MTKRLLCVAALLAMAAGAQAADLPSRNAYKAPVGTPTYFTPWEGAYGGIALGYGYDWTNTSITADTSIGNVEAALGNAPNGWMLGGRLGYDWNTGPFVIGLETDYQYANFQAGGAEGDIVKGNLVGALNWNARTDAWGSTNLRLGLPTFGNHVLLYGIGGVAYGGAVLNTNGGDVDSGASAYNLGWDGGVGIGTMLTNNSEVFAEARYVDLGSLNDAIVVPHAVAANLTQDYKYGVFMLGYNYHFK